jgi:hypothetical protein
MTPVARQRDAVAEDVVVPEGSNTIVIEARNHDWVALVQDGRELMRESSSSAETTFVAPAGTYSVMTDGKIDRVEVKTIDVANDPIALLSGEALLFLRLSSDAPDQHVIDGIGEIPADGESSCTVTVEKVDASGTPLRRRRDSDEVFIRTTGGTIMDAKGTAHIRSLKLRSGRASFRLVSEPTPRLVTVSALGKGSLTPAEIQLEFV